MRAGIVLTLAACVLAAGTGHADDAGKKDDDDPGKIDLAMLEGTWVIVGKEFMGKKSTKDEIEKLAAVYEVVVKDGKWTFWSNDTGKKAIVNEGMLKLDPKATPKELDIIYTSGQSKGTTDKTIYELDGDTLKVCYPVMSAKRPTEFAGKGDGNALFNTYKRVKK
jgi:RNA polymerase sigma-70 factor (ECF subfamily)